MIDVRIHVTRTTSSVTTAGTSEDATDEKDFYLYPVASRSTKIVVEVVPASPVDSFQVSLGRPDLLKLVQEEVESALGPVSVNGEHYYVVLPLS